jgi:tRNA-specific 2-thiouridylase
MPKDIRSFEFIVVNDGSTDSTSSKLKELHATYPNFVSVIEFSRNFGKEAAMYAGLRHATGDFVTRDGRILGQHKGIIRYTVGQRKGLGLALPAPMYVCEKDVKGNRVILSDNETLFTKTLTAENINLIPFDRIESSIRVKAKVRYKHQEQWATVHQTGEDSLFVEFDEPVRAIAKGQSLVMYDSDYVVGGGIIK